MIEFEFDEDELLDIERITFKSEFDLSGDSLEKSFDNRDGIQQMLNEFKYFLLGMSFPEELINEYLYDIGNGVEKIQEKLDREK